MIPLITDKAQLSEKTKREIEKSLREVKTGRTMSTKEATQRLKIDTSD